MTAQIPGWLTMQTRFHWEYIRGNICQTCQPATRCSFDLNQQFSVLHLSFDLNVPSLPLPSSFSALQIPFSPRHPLQPLEFTLYSPHFPQPVHSLQHPAFPVLLLALCSACCTSSIPCFICDCIPAVLAATCISHIPCSLLQVCNPCIPDCPYAPFIRHIHCTLNSLLPATCSCTLCHPPGTIPTLPRFAAAPAFPLFPAAPALPYFCTPFILCSPGTPSIPRNPWLMDSHSFCISWDP